jgi:hypothetical protein
MRIHRILDSPSTSSAWSHWSSRVAAEAIVNAPILSAQGMKAGLERIKPFGSARLRSALCSPSQRLIG